MPPIFVYIRSITELSNGDIVFFDANDTFQLWSKKSGSIEYLAKDVAVRGSGGGGSQCIPVITPDRAKPSFLFVDRDVVNVWVEQP